MKIENLGLHFSDVIERKLKLSSEDLRIQGLSQASIVGLLVSQWVHSAKTAMPQLVIVADAESVKSFAESVGLFDPTLKVHSLTDWDVHAYSGLFPNHKNSIAKLNFLFNAQNASKLDIFVTTATALLQLAIPFSVLSNNTFTLRVGDEWDQKLSDRLYQLGYSQTPVAEDPGQLAIRGGIIDVYSPAMPSAVRVSLYGDMIESLREIDIGSQRADQELKSITIIPASETLYFDENYEALIGQFRQSAQSRTQSRKVDQGEFDETLQQLLRKSSFAGVEYLLPYFYPKLDQVLDHFSSPLYTWIVDEDDILRSSDDFQQELKSSFASADSQAIRPDIESLYLDYFSLRFPEGSKKLIFDNLVSSASEGDHIVPYYAYSISDLAIIAKNHSPGSTEYLDLFAKKLTSFREAGYRVFISTKSKTNQDRLQLYLGKMNFEPMLASANERLWETWLTEQANSMRRIHILTEPFQASVRLEDEKLVFLRDDDFLGSKERAAKRVETEAFHKQARSMQFGDLKVGDFVVHLKHGVGVYEGLKKMTVNEVDAEFIQLSYRDKDRLYLPIYRINQLQKHSSAGANTTLDKLGGLSWEKAKVKVKSHLKDIASELLALYAKRAETTRPPLDLDSSEILKFDNQFPYTETEDQLRALEAIQTDFKSTKPMDRLICGDVGFGKTEIAMRAAFIAASNGKQVAVLAPTTVLTAQHGETFGTRFKGWPFKIKVLNRFLAPKDVKILLKEISEGQVDIVIGTHRLLSQDVQFKNLGLLIVDEEQKFGVTHKEKIKKLKISVDTISLSATPIPRTLNMALAGIRDLSLINTAPVDRLPVRTFISKFDRETIRKGILAEVHRGGQVYFVHNRIQSIYSLSDELREICPDIRMRIAHGQMPENELETTMVDFFKHEFDVLLSTAIIESGMDISRANTIFIDQAQIFGLSQLYQLRGRVGRSKSRAYCYLLIPRDRVLEKDAQERLKVIQENTALGSGIRIAQYDLELRGAGNLLGDDQSGHVHAVGYELYMDLLQEALSSAKGEDRAAMDVDPEINLRIPALIPDQYMGDIRMRLYYYKRLSEIESESELDEIEHDLRDQFGPPPEQVVNLMGVMLIRKVCKELGVKDIGAGVKTISLVFSESTKLKPDTVIKLASRDNKKYALTPDNRLNIRLNTISWANVYEEVRYLASLIN